VHKQQDSSIVKECSTQKQQHHCFACGGITCANLVQ
jgi:hypothetical protein